MGTTRNRIVVSMIMIVDYVKFTHTANADLGEWQVASRLAGNHLPFHSRLRVAHFDMVTAGYSTISRDATPTTSFMLQSFNNRPLAQTVSIPSHQDVVRTYYPTD